MELYQAHHQWMNRPADERFTSLLDLNAFCVSVRENSRGKTISSRALEVRPVDGDHKALMVVGPNGAPVTPTHWRLVSSPGCRISSRPALSANFPRRSLPIA